MLYEIESVENGYIVKNNAGLKSVYPNILSVFKDMLLLFESKSEYFSDASYGKVRINYKKPIKKKE